MKLASEAAGTPNLSRRNHQNDVPEFLTYRHTSITGKAKTEWSLHVPPGVAIDELESAEYIEGGYGGIQAAYYAMARELIKAGQAVVTSEPARWQAPSHALNPAHLFHPERLKPQSICRVLFDLEEEYGITKVRAAAHSMGGPAVLSAAVRCPKRFENITLLGSAGVSNHGIVTLAKRVPEVANEAFNNRDRLIENIGPDAPEAINALTRYIFMNPLRTALEAIGVSRSESIRNVRDLVRNGIPVGTMVFDYDGFFKPHEVAANIAGIASVWKEIQGVGHLAPQTHPDKVVAAWLDMQKQYNQLHHRAA